MPVTAIDLEAQEANNSPALAVDPTARQFVAMASRTDAPDFDCRLHVSGDGGRTWWPTEPVPRLPTAAEKCYAPEIAFAADGTLYYLFVGLHGRGNQPMGVFLTTSTDRARSFTPPVQVLGPGNYMVRMVLDRVSERLHLVWLAVPAQPLLGGLPATDNTIMTAYSDDGGGTFSSPVRVSDPERERVVAPALAIGAGGVLHVAYYDLRDDVRDYQGLEGPAWDDGWALVVSSGMPGEPFARHVVVDDHVVAMERVMLIFTMPPPALAADGHANVFAAWPDAETGDSDVLFARSSDSGRTWDRTVRLNDDRIGNGRHQYLPRVSIAPNGRVDAIFYDRRDDRDNVRNHLYHTFSADSGRTFAANRRVTSMPSDSRTGTTYPIPSARGLIEFGSRLATVSVDDTTLLTWTDTRHSFSGFVHQDVFAAELAFDGDANTQWQLLASAVAAAVAAALLIARHPHRDLAQDLAQADGQALRTSGRRRTVRKGRTPARVAILFGRSADDGVKPGG